MSSVYADFDVLFLLELVEAATLTCFRFIFFNLLSMSYGSAL